MMFWKTSYLAENASKNLIRTPGIWGTAVLVFLLSLITFCGVNGFYLLSDWYREVATGLREAENGTGSLIQLIQAPLIPIRIFQGLALLVTLCAGGTTIAYCHRSFRLFARTQEQDFKIMSLIGESVRGISGEFTLQSLLFLGTILGIAGIVANLLYWFSLAPSVCHDRFGSFGAMMVALASAHFPLMALALSYVALRLFGYVRRLLWSWLDGRWAVTA